MSHLLGIQTEEFESAIERLINVGLLERDQQGNVQRSEGRFVTADKETTNTAYKFHQQRILERSMMALSDIPIDERGQYSMTIATNPERIQLAKKMIENFINDITDVLETGELDELYQVSFSLFPFFVKRST